MFIKRRAPKAGTKEPEMGTRARTLRKTPARRRRRQRKPQASSVADALLSRTQQRVLGLLFGQPDRSFFAREIISRTAAGSGAVQRELARLVESGLLLMTRIGNQTHYQANRAAPIFEELRGIVTKTIGIAEPLREALGPLADRIDLALVYGSIAKGEDRSESDVDLLVVADDLLLEELFSCLAPAEQALGRRINPTLYTAADFRKRLQARHPFLTKVLAGDTIPLIGSEDAFTAAR